MKDQIEKQAIEEMALIICGFKDCTSCISRMGLRKCGAKAYAERFYNAGYRKQSEGEWKEHKKIARQSDSPPLLYYQCNLCGVYITKRANFCPYCGAKMLGGDINE